MKAMIFAAGLGTRLRPLTDTMPKALVPLNGLPLLEILLRKLERTGVDETVVNVHHFANQITDYLQARPTSGMRLRVSDESDCLLDTGGGLRKAFLPPFESDEPVVVHNVDIVGNADLAALYAKADNCDAVLLVSERTTQRYLLFDNDMRLVGWTNTATGEVRSPYPALRPDHCRRLAFAGIHVVGPRMLSVMADEPERFSIIDFYLRHCATLRFQGVVQDGLQLLDVGKIDGLPEAEHFYNTLKAKGENI